MSLHNFGSGFKPLLRFVDFFSFHKHIHRSLIISLRYLSTMRIVAIVMLVHTPLNYFMCEVYNICGEYFDFDCLPADGNFAYRYNKFST